MWPAMRAVNRAELSNFGVVSHVTPSRLFGGFPFYPMRTSAGSFFLSAPPRKLRIDWKKNMSLMAFRLALFHTLRRKCRTTKLPIRYISEKNVNVRLRHSVEQIMSDMKNIGFRILRKYTMLNAKNATSKVKHLYAVKNNQDTILYNII